MKKILYILILSWFSFFVSCMKLNVNPENIITDQTVFSSEVAITSYFATLYDGLDIEDFNFSPRNTFLSDESIGGVDFNYSSLVDGTKLDYWAYKQVRNVNDLIAKIPNTNFSDLQKNQWLGEAKFLRAYYYFSMVKRYGGIPLITDAQVFTGNNLADLQVPRNKEKEVYDFISKELDEAAVLMQPTSDNGRANKYVAYALKSRVMLYAASISKYGSVQLNGVLGIPSSDANTYWQAAYDAANMVINSGKYSLYKNNPDPAENFTNLFLDPISTENIFIKQYHFPEKAHNYDLEVLPHYGVGSLDGYGSQIGPTLEMVEAYEYIDGTNGSLKLNDGSGNSIHYSNPIDIFKNKDPRLSGAVLLPFSQYKSTVIEVRAGIIDGSTTINGNNNYNTLYKGLHVIGLNGIGAQQNDNSKTGFYVRQYLNPAYDKALIRRGTGTSTQSFIDLRYAEVLLNYAEAAIELVNVADSKTAINLIRSRAGIKLLVNSEVTRDRVRHERQIELAFEPHRFWDIRRWRIADQILNNTYCSVLLPYLVLDDNSYIFKKAIVGNANKIFLPTWYYERINPLQISTNPKLIQNPGY